MAKSQSVATTDNNAKPPSTQENERFIDVFKHKLDVASEMIMPLLPAHLTPEKFKSMVITTVAFDPKLQACSIPSLLRAVADAAELGLSLNKNMQECDILPIWSTKGDVAQCRPRYNGLMKLARQGGMIVDIYAHEVYENDEFSYSLGLDKHLIHKPAAGDRGALAHTAYVVWQTKDGLKGFEVATPKRIAAAKAASEGYKAFMAKKIKSTPWVDHESEMERKTAVRAGAKYMPRSTESDAFQRALALADDADFSDHNDAPGTQALIPPKPTRSSVKADTEAAKRQAQEMKDNERRARGAVVDDEPQDEPESPPHDEETGEVIENEPSPTPTPTPTPADNFNAKQTADLLLKKILNVDNPGKFRALVGDFGDELQKLEQAGGKEWKAVSQALEGKRTALKIAD